MRQSQTLKGCAVNSRRRPPDRMSKPILHLLTPPVPRCLAWLSFVPELSVLRPKKKPPFVIKLASFGLKSSLHSLRNQPGSRCPEPKKQFPSCCTCRDSYSRLIVDFAPFLTFTHNFSTALWPLELSYRIVVGIHLYTTEQHVQNMIIVSCKQT